jgi:hypothetical protein
VVKGDGKECGTAGCRVSASQIGRVWFRVSDYRRL